MQMARLASAREKMQKQRKTHIFSVDREETLISNTAGVINDEIFIVFL